MIVYVENSEQSTRKATRIEFRKFSGYKVNIQKLKCISIRLAIKYWKLKILNIYIIALKSIKQVLENILKGLCAENYKMLMKEIKKILKKRDKHYIHGFKTVKTAVFSI